MTGPLNEARPDLYFPAKPATDPELEAIKLTVDVAVGDTLFRAGTSLLQLVRQHRAFYGQLHQGKDQLL